MSTAPAATRTANMAEYDHEPIERDGKHVSINRGTQPACWFDPEDIGCETTALEPGLGITVAMVVLEAGFCGSILLVAIDADKGSADYNTNWRHCSQRS